MKTAATGSSVSVLCFIKAETHWLFGREAQHESRPRAKAEIRNPKTISKVQEVQRYQPALEVCIPNNIAFV